MGSPSSVVVNRVLPDRGKLVTLIGGVCEAHLTVLLRPIVASWFYAIDNGILIGTYTWPIQGFYFEWPFGKYSMTSSVGRPLSFLLHVCAVWYFVHDNHVILCSFVSMWNGFVTDGQTDRQTDTPSTAKKHYSYSAPYALWCIWTS